MGKEREVQPKSPNTRARGGVFATRVTVLLRLKRKDNVG